MGRFGSSHERYFKLPPINNWLIVGEADRAQLI
jgi:hypothetical protein